MCWENRREKEWRKTKGFFFSPVVYKKRQFSVRTAALAGKEQQRKGKKAYNLRRRQQAKNDCICRNPYSAGETKKRIDERLKKRGKQSREKKKKIKDTEKKEEKEEEWSAIYILCSRREKIGYRIWKTGKKEHTHSKEKMRGGTPGKKLQKTNKKKEEKRWTRRQCLNTSSYTRARTKRGPRVKCSWLTIYICMYERKNK